MRLLSASSSQLHRRNFALDVDLGVDEAYASVLRHIC